MGELGRDAARLRGLQLHAHLPSFRLELADVQVHQEVRQLHVLLHELLSLLHLHLSPYQLDRLPKLIFIIANITHG